MFAACLLICADGKKAGRLITHQRWKPRPPGVRWCSIQSTQSQSAASLLTGGDEAEVDSGLSLAQGLVLLTTSTQM